jgi:hypothetical protein
VECKFKDAWNKEHIVHEKVPVVTEKDLDMNSEYPQEGIIACEILKKWLDKDNRIINTISTEKPWAIETTFGLSELDVLDEQLTEFIQ